jgi:hypothetical protein
VRFSTIAPAVASRIQRRLGSDKIAADLGDGQADKR